MTAVYLDASALVKLVVPEAETESLRQTLAAHDELLSALVSLTEVMRATRRWIAATGAKGKAAADRLRRAEELMASIALIDLDLAGAFQAAATEPVELRSLDAIHLATAVALVGDLDGFVTYDLRLATAARDAGLPVMSPS
ncbi:MAG: type II toxin-antitoxin system VapC family toxin [Candidatus Dormibacteria bacterium]